MSVSGSQVAAHYRHQAQKLVSVIESYRKLVAELQAADATLTEQRAQARRELAAVYLPELSDAAFERVGRLTGFQGFARRDPRAALAHERHVLEQSIATIEHDPRYMDRDNVARRLAAEVESARDTLAPLQAECDRFETQLGFTELVELGYDTPAFQVKWWQASYWKHWAAGDRICKALGMRDFGDDVLPAYKQHAEPRNYMRDEVKRIDSELDALHELVREHDRLADRYANLDAIFLAESQDYLGEHLEHADAALLEQWVAAEPSLQRAVQVGLRKLAGLAAKKRFLGDIAQGTNTLVGQLDQRRRKASSKVEKFARPKHAYSSFPDHMINSEFDHKVTAMGQQRDKLGRRVHVLVQADNYAGFDLRNDQELWWLYLMESPPPRVAPSLYDYYQRRPGVQPITDPDYVDMGPSASEAAAMAYAAGELEQGGYLS
jgi:hypothetical protein